MQPEMTPIIPLEQIAITFAGYTFLVVRLPDGRISVVFNHLCQALALSRRAQTRRIERHPLLAKHFLLARIKTNGGPQVVNVLVVLVMPLWLGGFDLTRLSEEKRGLIIALMEDAEEAFSRPFEDNSQARPQQQTKATLSPSPLPPQDEAALTAPELLRSAASRIEQKDQRIETRLAGVEQDNQKLEARLTSVEQENQRLEAMLVTRDRQQMEEAAWRAEMQHQMQLQQGEIEVLWSVVLSSAAAGEDALSAERQQALQLLLRYHQRVTGQPLATIRRELLGVVGAASLDHLRESDWRQIVNWFRQQRA